MKPRSDRNKIRWQCKKILDKVEDIYQHLRYIDELANGRSEFISENLPVIFRLTKHYEQVLRSFRDLL